MDQASAWIAKHPLLYTLLSPPLAVLINDLIRVVKSSANWTEARAAWKPSIATWHAVVALFNAAVNIPIIAGVVGATSAVVGFWMWR